MLEYRLIEMQKKKRGDGVGGVAALIVGLVWVGGFGGGWRDKFNPKMAK